MLRWLLDTAFICNKNFIESFSYESIIEQTDFWIMYDFPLSSTATTKSYLTKWGHLHGSHNGLS